MGDVIYSTYRGSKQGPSTFVDVCVQEDGIYSCLDSKRGRIFTYDFDGNLLYVFGGDGSMGNQLGTFNDPSALGFADGSMMILDKGTSQLTVFSITEYGQVDK